MTTRTYVAGVEGLTQSSDNTTSTPADHLSITIPDASASSSTWAIFFTCAHAHATNTTTQTRARLYHSTATTVLQQSWVQIGATGGDGAPFYPLSGCIPVTFGASPGDQTFKLQYFNETGVAAVHMRDAVMFAIKVGANDATASATSTSTSSSTTWVDKVTFTAPATATFDIFFTSETTAAATGNLPGWRILFEDGTTTAYTGFTASATMKTTADIVNRAAHVRRSLTSGQTVKLQFNRTSGSSTITSQNAHAVGFKTADFDNTYSAIDLTSRTTTSGSYVTRNAASKLTFTPAAAVDHFLFGSCTIEATDGSTPHFVRSMMVGTEYQEWHNGQRLSTAYCALGLRFYTDMPVASSVLDWEIKSNGTNTLTSIGAGMNAWQVEAATTDTPVTPGVLALTTATFAPSVVVNQIVTPGVKALTISTFAPSVVVNQIVTPSVAALTVTTFAPSVVVNQIVTPDVLALSISTFAPSVVAGNNQAVTPSTLALTIATFAPTVAVSGNQAVTPGALALTVSTFAPSVVVNQILTPDVLALTVTTFAPAVVVNHVVTPDTLALTTATFAPSIVVNHVVAPDTLALTTATFAPSVVADQLVTPGVLALVIATFAPTIFNGPLIAIFGRQVTRGYDHTQTRFNLQATTGDYHDATTEGY